MIILGRSHNPKSQGAKTLDGKLSEWMIADDVNDAIQDELKNRCNIEKYILRLGGYLHERIYLLQKMGRLSHYDCAIECHCNIFSDSTQRGFSVLAWHTSKKSIHLANCILKEIAQLRPDAKNKGVNMVSTSRRWIGTDKEHGGAPGLALLEDTPSPSVIVEACYLSNPREGVWISKSINRRSLGWVIGRGINNWLNESKELHYELV